MVFRPGIPSSLCALLVLALAGGRAGAQVGPTLSGVGPINRSLGGASTAAAVDSLGALYWNPAVISGLPQNEMEFGAEVFVPQLQVSSTVPAGAAGPLGPPVTLSGSDRASLGQVILPSLGLVYRPEDSRLTYGLGLYAPAGFLANYPADPRNPILSPQPPQGIGVGPVSAEFDLLQVAPTVSYQVTDRLSVGFAPTVNLARVMADPATLAAPNPTGIPGLAVYPAGTHTHWSWGLGAQAGAFYRLESGWNFGASIKTPQWFQPFQYFATDLAGHPRTFQFHIDYPMFISAGVSYTGIERWLFAADFRFVDWHNTPGFSHTGFDSTGAVQGLGWRNIFALALGTQYKVSDSLSARMGYTYNMSPVPAANTAFNVASPVIAEHAIYFGASYHITQSFLVSVAYAHAFLNSVEGPYITPAGTLPGASIRSQAWGDTFLAGATVKF